MRYRANGRRTYYVPGSRDSQGWDRPIPPIWDSAPRLGLGPVVGAHWSHDPEPEPDPQPVRGHQLAALSEHGLEYDKGKRGPLADRQVPEFVLVRAKGSHDLFQVEHTGTGWTLTRPRPLAAAKLALATMRSTMGKMGRVA